MFEPLRVRMATEVRGEHAQGKPRLRKHAPRDRQKLHLPQLVMAVACLPEPRREDSGEPVHFPLENKQFLMDSMVFQVVDTSSEEAVLSPLSVSILHSSFEVDLHAHLRTLARDWRELPDIRLTYPQLGEAVTVHERAVRNGVNSADIRAAADDVIRLKSTRFGPSNAGSAHALLEAEALPEVAAEEITGREGKLLVRMHHYKERDRRFARRVREHYKARGNGVLTCQACGVAPSDMYGEPGERAMEAHHKVPIEELQPDSDVRIEDMAMLCANCHRVVHSRRPCLTVDDLRDIIGGS